MMGDCKNFNVIEDYKGLTVEEVNEELRSTAFPYAVLMQHIMGDFNIGTLIRNANAFNAEKVFYFGKKRYRRTGTVGTHHYTDLNYLEDMEELQKLKSEYKFVGLDKTEDSKSFYQFDWGQLELDYSKVGEKSLPATKKVLFLFGEENNGLIPEVLEMCDVILHLPQYGSVRSINVGTASGIVMSAYTEVCSA